MDLETPRLHVRELTPADLDAVHAILDVDLTMNPCTKVERARWLEWTILGYEQQRRLHQVPYGDRGIVLKRTGELVGLAGLVPSMMPFGLLPHHPDGSARNLPEVGLFWAVASAHQRNGYAAEAGAALVDFAFTQWHVRRIVATTEDTNVASAGVMRRIGMRVDRNPFPAPFFLGVVGIVDNAGGEPEWPATP
jgi:[ribosomal protein S5]-alanine N-acetyltransferase